MKHIQIISNLVINTKNKTIANQDGKQVTLRPLAYDVLQVLIKNDGLAVSRDELFAQCWTGCIVSDQALTNVISNIRQTLLRLRAEGVEVLTVNKVGYRFCITEPKHPSLLKKFNTEDTNTKHQKELIQAQCDIVTHENPHQVSTTQNASVRLPVQNQSNFTQFLLGLMRSTQIGSKIDSHHCYLTHSQGSGFLQVLGLLMAFGLLAVTAYCSMIHAKDRSNLDQQHFEKLTNNNKTLYVNDESEYLLALQILNNAIYANELLQTDCPVSLLIQFDESTTYANHYSLNAQIFDLGDLDDLKYSHSSLSQNELVPAINTMIKNSMSLCAY
ncbi:winged helix-turn-helix domain-containing protein [Vibrio sp. D420a]|uniref:winged helix-turn-helix domain-containing protein n=1 Tax=Vibrio sp. D420a TaxID=2836895 RepID=UPI002552D8AC|nr:winged helix-turn-helix domain-containing protein [Vibrio sp. D420a]MDK9760631.1 winged helix-turn-helix domain-containing protein [Vibrio sp. D420a]